MKIQFSSLQRLVLNPSSELSIQDRENVLLIRVANALRDDISRVGSADIAVLVRQALIACQNLDEGPHTLRVPTNSRWPDAGQWRQFGCDAQTAAIGFYFVSVSSVYPKWLTGQINALEAAIRAEPRRPDRRVASDPEIDTLLGYHHYSSAGQRTAVRTAFLMPPSATTLVLLPTGAGKSLIFHSAALACMSESALTVVVVPTVALAKDQDLRFRELLKGGSGTRADYAAGVEGPFCYHGGLSKDEREDFRTSLAQGSIPVLFASPESLLNSLRPSLFLAARRGKLRYFVVDEVHMVAQWGEQFRPEFRMLAGLRDSLMAACPSGSEFRTLLLTATLTSDSYRTIRSLFSSFDFRVVSELALRPEPEYLIRPAKDDVERSLMIEDAIRLFPRPLILYTSLRDDADRWSEQIRSLGFRRTRLVRGGDLTSGPGETTLLEWKNRDVDVIVATSAFGLGVDQNEVRTVLHACLPESIDRFYQEVGRSGRDGRASISLLATAPSDEKTAANLSSKARISIDRGFERWSEMWIRRRRISDGVFAVSLDETPVDIIFSGTQNASWNLRTLVLMRTARLIDFSPHLPPEIKRFEHEDKSSFEVRRAEYLKQAFREVAIRILDAGHSDKTFWDECVSGARKALRAIEERSFAWTKELLDLKRPIEALLREVYTVPDLDLRPPIAVPNSNVPCGSPTSPAISPEVRVIPPLGGDLSPTMRTTLSPCRDDAGRFWVSYEVPTGDALKIGSARQAINEVLRFAVSGGFLELALPDWIDSPQLWSMLAHHTSTKFILRTQACSAPEEGLYIPRLTMLGGSEVDQTSLRSVLMADCPAHLVLFTTNLRDPRRLDRKISDVVPHISIHNFLSRLQA